MRRVLILRGRGGPSPGRRGSPLREQRQGEAAADRAGVPHPARPWRQPHRTPCLESRGSSAVRTLRPVPGSGPGGSLSPRAGFRGGHAVGPSPLSFRARPLPLWNRAFPPVGPGSARPGDVTSGSWALWAGRAGQGELQYKKAWVLRELSE